jgi:hypothetical protein
MAEDEPQNQVPPAQPLIPDDGGAVVARELSESVRGSGAVMLPTASAQGIDPVAHMDGAPVPAAVPASTSNEGGGSAAVQGGGTSQSSSSNE